MAYKSLIQDMEMIRGTSSDIYMFSTDMTDDLSTWEARYAIAENLEDPNPIVDRALPLNDGSDGTPVNSAFIFQMLPHETQILTPDRKYWVSIEIKNDALQYNSEIARFNLKILPQGAL